MTIGLPTVGPNDSSASTCPLTFRRTTVCRMLINVDSRVRPCRKNLRFFREVSSVDRTSFAETSLCEETMVSASTENDFFVKNVKKSLLSKHQSAGKIFVRSLSCKIFVLPSSLTFKSWSEAANIDKTNMRLHYWSHCCCLDDDWLAFRSQLLKPMSKCLPSCFHEKLISARIKITQNPGQ